MIVKEPTATDNVQQTLLEKRDIFQKREKKGESIVRVSDAIQRITRQHAGIAKMGKKRHIFIRISSSLTILIIARMQKNVYGQPVQHFGAIRHQNRYNMTKKFSDKEKEGTEEQAVPSQKRNWRKLCIQCRAKPCCLIILYRICRKKCAQSSVFFRRKSDSHIGNTARY